MGDDKPVVQPESSYVLAERDYSDVAHLENPSVIERILSASRREATAYVGRLLQSGVARYALAGPKVAFTAMAIEALTDLGKEVSEWRRVGRIPEDFSGRPSGYQTWVELLREIDSNPVDVDRLKAMKAMFLAANRINATDGESILAYQLFQIAKKLSSGELLVLKAARGIHGAPGQLAGAQDWLIKVSDTLGHRVTALVAQQERGLIDNGLISPRIDQNLRVSLNPNTGRLTDLGLAFCRNIDDYEAGVPS
jgi:hypothetical protein